MQCFALIRKLLSFLPQNNEEEPPIIESKDPPDRTDEELRSLVPKMPYEPYDMLKIILKVVDSEDFLQVHQASSQLSIHNLASQNSCWPPTHQAMSQCRTARLTTSSRTRC
jgi:hypothetical protein